jgi:predicted regulator of Ras-like GTPase activity (Roadblock/LC7/MglB family)
LEKFKAIKAFFVFEKETGNTVFTRSYETKGTKTPDAHLVVAVLSAMFSFAKSSSSLSELRVVDMTDLRFSFIERDGLVFAVLASPLVSPMDLQFKLTTISSLFLSEYATKLCEVELIDTELFEGFNESVDGVFLGETREMLTSSKNAALFYLKKLVQKEDIGARGAMIVSFTGDILIEYEMDQKRMAGAIRILNVSTYMRNLRYLVVSSEVTHLVAYKISEGLLLYVDGDPSSKLENLVVKASETVKQIKEVIPH